MFGDNLHARAVWMEKMKRQTVPVPAPLLSDLRTAWREAQLSYIKWHKAEDSYFSFLNSTITKISNL